MALVFCDDGGSNTSPYETWAKAATTFTVAEGQAIAGDDIIIGADHSEVLGGNLTMSFAGTDASPIRVISATVGADSDVAYNKADNVQIDGSSGSRSITITGVVKFYGVSFKIGNNLILNGDNGVVYFEDSAVELTGASSSIDLNNSTTRTGLILKNTDINFSTGGASTGFQMSGGWFVWDGGAWSQTGTQPTATFNAGLRRNVINMRGVDLSAITSAFIDIGDNFIATLQMHHCLINSGVALATGTILRLPSTLLLSGCDDTTGNNLYRLEYVDYWGSTVDDDTIFLNASDGTTPISWKMVSTTNAAEFSDPTKSPPIYSWVDATGETTFTASFVWDSASDLQDDEVWLEIEYLEASADVDSAFADDRMADISATPVDQDNNTEAWTGADGFTNKNRQEVAVTVTVNRVGPVIARVCLAKPSTTIYVDPLVVKS